MKAKRVTYGQLKHVLTKMGFKETRRPNGVALEHAPSDTLFLFRPYADSDKLQPGEVFLVSQDLEAQGLLEPESFEALLSRATA